MTSSATLSTQFRGLTLSTPWKLLESTTTTTTTTTTSTKRSNSTSKTMPLRTSAGPGLFSSRTFRSTMTTRPFKKPMGKIWRLACGCCEHGSAVGSADDFGLGCDLGFVCVWSLFVIWVRVCVWSLFLFFFLLFVLLWSRFEFLVVGFVFLVVGFDLGRTRRTSCNVLMKNNNDK